MQGKRICEKKIWGNSVTLPKYLSTSLDKGDILYFIYYISYFIFHMSYFWFHILYIKFYISYFIYDISYFTFNISYFIYNISYIIFQISYCIYHVLFIKFHNPMQRKHCACIIFLPILRHHHTPILPYLILHETYIRLKCQKSFNLNVKWDPIYLSN